VPAIRGCHQRMPADRATTTKESVGQPRDEPNAVVESFDDKRGSFVDGGEPVGLPARALESMGLAASRPLGTGATPSPAIVANGCEGGWVGLGCWARARLRARARWGLSAGGLGITLQGCELLRGRYRRG
jgi:hypothetical protein